MAAYREAGQGQFDPIVVLERTQDALYGFDLNPFACYLTEVNLLIQTLDLVKMGSAPQVDDEGDDVTVSN